MSRPRFHLVLLGVGLFFPVSSFAQAAPGFADTPGDGRVAEWKYGEHIPPIAKLPFTAKVELETVNQLPDGMLITHKTYNLVARDSLGRTHNEGRKWIDPNTSEEPKLLRVVLYDPRTRTRTNLFPLTKIARQWTGSPDAGASPQIAAGKPEISRENIDADIIEGIPVHGTRVSQTYKAGTLGNDRPLTIITEYWYSEELKINLLTKRTDPRFGVQTVHVTELTRQEPDPSLFAISSDYKVVNETLPDQQGRAETMSADSQGSASPPSGVARAGVAGTTVPICIYCPNPSYTDKARSAKIQGSVILQITVTANGQAENISVVRGPGLGLGLEESAMETVKNWRFKPAHGPDGNAVATLVPVQVTFRLQ
jgi:TonB family protein